ncbi:glycosyl transferase family 2 [Ectothiorhodospira shaposhnikovii]|uniref:glycosyltransferase family 2 protein n=1 Tax=Ectothiorhodospira shaposhnikovii TaxID=1054 RepID=UPI001904CA03|nr:glycosyltransferase family 2 protein [Ectothiorhodospira shaposhnikovii]MBK1672471.1 glycosyl transferase family 2 [Ectothiorhodospira shaposhnikovii]
MLEGNKIVVVLPAYNAARTLEKTWRELPRPLIDDVVLVDDASDDETLALAHDLGIPHIVRHPVNRGYGANQKTCYRYAMDLGADIVIMLHPDYQYTPKLIPAMASIIASGLYPVVLGSRILGNGALPGGMPRYKYVANRALTAFQNLCTGAKLSEYHTGYRAFSARVLREIPFEHNADGFIFDNQMLCQIIQAGHGIAEVTCPTRYFPEASSIRLIPSTIYGLGVVDMSVRHLLHRTGLLACPLYRGLNDARE